MIRVGNNKKDTFVERDHEVGTVGCLRAGENLWIDLSYSETAKAKKHHIEGGIDSQKHTYTHARNVPSS